MRCLPEYELRMSSTAQKSTLPLWRALTVCASLLLVTGCGSTIAQAPLIGEPENAPRAQGVSPEFPSVTQRPHDRSDKPMTATERAQAEAELTTARTQAAADRRRQISQPSQ